MGFSRETPPRLRLVAVAIFTSLAISWPTCSVAGFLWLNPWAFLLDQNDAGKRTDFGNADADVAVSRAEAIASEPNSLVNARVQFERPFRLSGSPGGWNVALQGLLSGRLAVTDPNEVDIGAADVLARATVFDNNGNLKFSIRPAAQLNGEGVTDVFDLVVNDLALLDDGDYRIEGLLSATAGAVLGNPPVLAQSLFFDGGWAVGITATPVFEPGILTLLASGIFGLIVAMLPRRRPERCGPPGSGSLTRPSGTAHAAPA